MILIDVQTEVKTLNQTPSLAIDSNNLPTPELMSAAVIS